MSVVGWIMTDKQTNKQNKWTKITEPCNYYFISIDINATCFVWRLWNHASLTYSFKYNQQDATLHNILYCCQRSTCFRRFLRPSSGTQKVYTQDQVYAKLAWVAVAASKLGIYLILCVQFLSSWWWTEKPPDTCRALTTIKDIV